ncbi:SDR family NAD(P)-dependent oxidoreductase [Mycolicibacterium elephantis]|uniref:Short-chain dehydrogenase n=1 Tax=Mycolicibacterium elephantis DSM 44368 TaxID=1335622 RepID=A0A439DSZ1_9MYCO|nr:SDR family oxidoreductase [Mycolicibacterium elephantis]RWA19464.1 short-chain dehydrogenase [Mycolicibacterium elephantis DSM 44368]
MRDKVVLVTGGSRGLGRAMTLGFARAGADVIIASRKLDSCADLAAEVVQTTGRRAVPIAANVGRWEDCDALYEAAYQAFPRVDVLVNNAGMSPLYDRPSEVTETLYDKVLGVNLRGPFRLTALFGERMMTDGGGSVINISSVSGVNPGANVIPYGAAKAGLNSITVSFARAYGPQVRVNCIMVGRFRTDVSKHWDEAATAAEVEQYALRRVGEPDEVVGTALYLASDASSYTTGAILRVDGGTPY